MQRESQEERCLKLDAVLGLANAQSNSLRHKRGFLMGYSFERRELLFQHEQAQMIALLNGYFFKCTCLLAGFFVTHDLVDRDVLLM
jgi:hypothetical protein